MQIVIDIPEQMYLNAKADTLCGADILVSAIKNATPLPKGHGRLIDADELLKNKEKFFSVFEEDIGGHYSIRQKYIDNALTIIDADKE